MMNDRQDNDREDLLQRAIDSVRDDPFPEEPPPNRVLELVAVVRQTAEQPSRVTMVERVKNMKTTTGIAVAASLVIVCGGLLSWLAPGGGSALAFGDVAEAFANVHSATWKKTSVAKDPQGKTIKLTGIGMFLAPSHERTEMSMDGKTAVLITDGRKDKVLGLDVAEKTATIFQLENLPAESPFGHSFQGLRKRIVDAQTGADSSVERLGVEIIDGRRVGGFRVRQGSLVITLWAEPKSSLPVRVEYESTVGPKVREVMTDFQINVDLEQSLFSLDVPSGYTVLEQVKMDLSKRPIEHLAEALGLAAEHNGGVFPPTLLGEDGIDGIMRRAAAELVNEPGKSRDELLKISSDWARKMGAVAGVLYNLSPEQDWHYTGKDVKRDTPNRPIFWYRLKKDDPYEVIYADLTIKEVSPEDVPQEPEDDPEP